MTCPDPFCSRAVRNVVATAGEGVTIYVCPGIYGKVTFNNKHVTLIGAGDGAGPESTILYGEEQEVPAVTIDANSTVTLRAIRITGVKALLGQDPPGGGILNDGSLSMIDCTVTGNTAAGTGGGIRNNNDLTMRNCSVDNNTNSDQNLGAGGIFSNGTLTLEGCQIENNSAAGDGGGMYLQAGDVSLDGDCRVTQNTANTAGLSYSGGGIYNFGSNVTLGGDFPTQIVTLNHPDNCAGSLIVNCDHA